MINNLRNSFFTIYAIEVISLILMIIGVFSIYNKAGLPDNFNFKGIDIRRETLFSTGDVSVNGVKVSNSEDIEIILDEFFPDSDIRIEYKLNESIIEDNITLIRFYDSYYLITASFLASLFWVVGFVVLMNNHKSQVHYVFNLVCIFAALIVTTTWGNYTGILNQLVRIIFGYSFVFAPVLLLYFFLIFPARESKTNKNLIISLCILAFIIGTAHAYYFLQLLSEKSLQTLSQYQHAFNIERIFAIVIYISSIVILLHSYLNKKDKISRNKIKWILSGLFIGIFSYTLLWIVPQLLQKKPPVPETVILLLIIPLPISFAISIIKFNLFDIDRVINRGVVYSSSLFGVSTVFYLIILSLKRIIIFDNILSELVLIFLFSFITWPIFVLVKNLIDKKIFKLNFVFRDAINDFLYELNRSLTVEDIYTTLKKHISKNIFGALAREPQSELTNILNSHQGDTIQLVMNKKLVVTDNSKIIIDNNLPTSSCFILFPNQEDSLNPIEISLPKNKYILEEEIDLIKDMAYSAQSLVEVFVSREKLLKQKVQNEKLKEINELKSYFVANVSHDLKTPLTSIKMFAEMMLDNIVEDEVKKKQYLNLIFNESCRLQNYIDNVLDYSRVERGVKEYTIVELFPSEILQEIELMLKYIIERKGGQIIINSNYGGSIKADKDAFINIIINLVSNAIKYSPDDINVIINSYNENGNYLVSVKDRGKGIDSEDITKIFEPYFQEDYNHQSTMGIGIGLAVVKHAVDAHNAKIEIDSEVGKGTEVRIIFSLENYAQDITN